MTNYFNGNEIDITVYRDDSSDKRVYYIDFADCADNVPSASIAISGKRHQ